jgi:prepilin-type N-terminal cleavage/methylation domain-containing protein
MLNPEIHVVTFMKRQTGFTLIEIAVVVFLIGLLAAMGISALTAQLSNAAISATKKKQDTIKDALITYLGKNKRLPCPAIDNSGVEAPRNIAIPLGDPNCQGNFGIVPYATLDLTKSAALDGWENFFSYAVTPQWTMTYSNIAPVAGGTTSNIGANAFNAGSTGIHPVNDRASTSPYTAIPVTTNAVVVIVSHGKNGSGALTSKSTPNFPPGFGTDELANAPVSPWSFPAAFYQREYTEVDVLPYGAYDDVLQWFSAKDMLLPLVKDGALKSAEAQWADQALSMQNALVGYMLSNSNCAPPPSNQYSNLVQLPNGISTVDPWGRTVEYVQCISQLTQTGTYTQTINLSSQTFINQSTSTTQNYSNLCTVGGTTQLPFAILVITNTTTSPNTKLPVLTNFTVPKVLGANGNFISSNCP